MPRPDYSGGGFVNLIVSLAATCGARPRHATLAALPPESLSKARNVVLVILDGLGHSYLMRHGALGALGKHRRGAISAVFPSTTASAITTSFTGATPLEHGLTGWFTYFGEAGRVAAPLPFRSRGDNASLRARGLAPSALFTEPPIFDALGVRSIVVSWLEIVHSDYNRHHCGRAERRAYASLEGFVLEVERAVKSGTERKFVYAYWPAFDTLADKHGGASGGVAGDPRIAMRGRRKSWATIPTNSLFSRSYSWRRAFAFLICVVEAQVLDRDRGLAGEGEEEVQVLVGEGRPAHPVGHGEEAEDLPAPG